jgi:hypothetical protein
MWPDPMGPGWVPQLMIAVGLLGAVTAVLKILAAAATVWMGQRVPIRSLAYGTATRKGISRLRRQAAIRPAGTSRA